MSKKDFSAMHLKVKCGDDVRLLTIDRTADLAALKDKLRDEFAIEGDFNVKYLDEDGDMITLSKDTEWRATCDSHAGSSHRHLRLEVQNRGPAQYLNSSRGTNPQTDAGVGVPSTDCVSDAVGCQCFTSTCILSLLLVAFIWWTGTLYVDTLSVFLLTAGGSAAAHSGGVGSFVCVL
eukprot:Opistho-2@85252